MTERPDQQEGAKLDDPGPAEGLDRVVLHLQGNFARVGVILGPDVMQELVKAPAGRGEIGGVAPFQAIMRLANELRICLAASGILAPSRW